MVSTDKSKLVLARTASDRIWGCVFGLLMTPFMAYIGYCLHEGWKPADRAEQLLQFLVVDFFFTSASFLALGLVWTLFAPRWLAGVLQGSYGKLKLAIGGCVLGFALSVACLAFAR